MAKDYRQLTYWERKRIEEGLNDRLSFRAIADDLGRVPSTISREVKENRVPYRGKSTKVKCGQRKTCEKSGLCSDLCPNGAFLCADCKVRDCRDVCPDYIAKGICHKITRSPWVCNGCSRLRYGCNRTCRVVYRAKSADELSKERRSESRSGIATELATFESAIARVKDGISRGLSPYEIATLYETEVGVSRSTIYRWVEAGYGGLTNLELERKVGFRPRRVAPKAKSTSHSAYRSYKAFCSLSEEMRASRCEMDTIRGTKIDSKCALTLYFAPFHLQFLLLLHEKTSKEVKRQLNALKSVCAPSLFKLLFHLILTDNGEEFLDERGIGAILGESRPASKSTRLYYCDPRASQQKGSCEKNHSEVRQILKKGLFVFDELTQRDLCVVMSHVNSNPRDSLGGLSPIDMFLAATGDAGQDLLDALGVKKIDRDRIMLKPDILDIERKMRGEEPLTHLK